MTEDDKKRRKMILKRLSKPKKLIEPPKPVSFNSKVPIQLSYYSHFLIVAPRNVNRER